MTSRHILLQFSQKIFARSKRILFFLTLVLAVWVVWLNNYASLAWWWDSEETVMLLVLAAGFWVTAFLGVALLPMLLLITLKFAQEKSDFASGQWLTAERREMASLNFVVASLILTLVILVTIFSIIGLLLRGVPLELVWFSTTLLSPLFMVPVLLTIGAVMYVASTAGELLSLNLKSNTAGTKV